MNQASSTPQNEPESVADEIINHIDKKVEEEEKKAEEPKEELKTTEEVLTIERLIPVTFKKIGQNLEIIDIKDHELKQILITTDGEGLIHHLIPRSQLLETLLANVRDLARKNHTLRHDNNAARDVSAGHRRSYERTMQDYETQGHMMDDPADTFLRSHALTLILFSAIFIVMVIFFYLNREQTQDFIDNIIGGS